MYENFQEINSLITLKEILKLLPVDKEILSNIEKTRNRIKDIIFGRDKRLLVIIGPCSIHDVKSAMKYAYKLNYLRSIYKTRLEIIMRTYIEKPRTINGWKGLVFDPELNNSYKINSGLKIARKLLIKINRIGLPTSMEFLDMYIGRYISDLISWGSIGARTTESPIHRNMVSCLPCPIGFKNSTDGNFQVAIDAILASRLSHVIIAPNKNGSMKIYKTYGNIYTHLIMRGGKIPNYKFQDIKRVCEKLNFFGLPEFLMIDFSHGNSSKNYIKQKKVSQYICNQISIGNKNIIGVMIESNLVQGKQELNQNKLKYGQSITDSCLGWNDSVNIIENIKLAVDQRFI